MKTLKKIALAGILPAIIVAILLLSNTSSGEADEISSGTYPPPPTEEWLTYTDERFDFQVKHPDDWYVEVSPLSIDGSGSVTISNYSALSLIPKAGLPENYFRISIVALTGEPLVMGESLTDWRNSRIGFDSNAIKEEEIISIAGTNALFQLEEHPSGIESLILFVPYSNKTYGEFVFIILSPVNANLTSELFWEFAQTFKFTK